MSIRGYRPCGACRSLVPEMRGCKHWKPAGHGPLMGKKMHELTPEQREVRREQNRERSRRARQREYEKAARERARHDVDQFRRMMTGEAR